MIYVVLPAYNEEQNVRELLNELCLTMVEVLPHMTFELVVIDDGSQDNTVGAVEDFRCQPDKEYQNRAEVTMIRHDINQGLAEAIKTGLSHCKEKAGERDIILIMDSDNSHTPGLIPSMVRVIHEGYDVVIASRYQRGARVIGLSMYRRLLSWCASCLLRVLFPIPNVRDYTCGFRAYRASLIKQILAENPQFISEQGFSVMVDILLKLRRIEPEVMFAEVPLLLRYDKKLGASKMAVGRTVREILWLIVRRRFG